jgi:hypothetical protein
MRFSGPWIKCDCRGSPSLFEHFGEGQLNDGAEQAGLVSHGLDEPGHLARTTLLVQEVQAAPARKTTCKKRKDLLTVLWIRNMVR